jgi:hypothetical protein
MGAEDYFKKLFYSDNPTRDLEEQKNRSKQEQEARYSASRILRQVRKDIKEGFNSKSLEEQELIINSRVKDLYSIMDIENPFFSKRKIKYGKLYLVKDVVEKAYRTYVANSNLGEF